MLKQYYKRSITMVVLLYFMKVLLIISVCSVGTAEVITNRNEYASREGIINLLKRQPNGKVQVNDYLSVKLYDNHIIINLYDEVSVVHEIQRITRKKSDNDFIFRKWRKPIIRKMKQIYKKDKKREQQMEQQSIKEDLEHKKNKKKKRKQYHQTFKEENRKKHEKYADYYKHL